MGTVVSFSIMEERDTTTEREARAAGTRIDDARRRAEAWLRWVDDVFSTWKPESPVSRLRRGEIGLGDAPPEVAEVLELCRRARVASDGWFDPWAMPGGVDPTGLVKGWAAASALDEFEAGRRAGGDDQRRRRHRRVRAAGAGTAVADRDPAPAGGGQDPADRRPGRRRRRRHLRLLRARRAHLSTRAAAGPTTALLSATVIGHDLAFADALATGLYASGGELLEQHLAARRLPRVHRGRPRAGPRLPRLPHRAEGVEAVPA